VHLCTVVAHARAYARLWLMCMPMRGCDMQLTRAPMHVARCAVAACDAAHLCPMHVARSCPVRLLVAQWLLVHVARPCPSAAVMAAARYGRR
jgi:hypothetical protein